MCIYVCLYLYIYLHIHAHTQVNYHCIHHLIPISLSLITITYVKYTINTFIFKQTKKNLFFLFLYVYLSLYIYIHLYQYKYLNICTFSVLVFKGDFKGDFEGKGSSVVISAGLASVTAMYMYICV
jgi:hypothetical protein